MPLNHPNDPTMQKSNLHFFSKLRFLSKHRHLQWYPPFWLMRIKLLKIDEHWNHIQIRLPLTWISANAAGNIFGGFQANLADPIPAIACVEKFPDYRVATKKLEIDFLRIGNSDLILNFDFDADQLIKIKTELEEFGRSTPCFNMTYTRSDGKVCTVIKNTVAIRPKGYVGSLDKGRSE